MSTWLSRLAAVTNHCMSGEKRSWYGSTMPVRVRWISPVRGSTRVMESLRALATSSDFSSGERYRWCGSLPVGRRLSSALTAGSITLTVASSEFSTKTGMGPVGRAGVTGAAAGAGAGGVARGAVPWAATGAAASRPAAHTHARVASVSRRDGVRRARGESGWDIGRREVAARQCSQRARRRPLTWVGVRARRSARAVRAHPGDAALPAVGGGIGAVAGAVVGMEGVRRVGVDDEAAGLRGRRAGGQRRLHLLDRVERDAGVGATVQAQHRR